MNASFKMNSNKNIAIKKNIIETQKDGIYIFKKASYTPFIGDEYGSKEKILYVGDLKIPKDEAFIKDAKKLEYPEVNYCTQIMSYCNRLENENLDEIKKTLGKRNGAEVINKLTNDIQKRELSIQSIAYYNFFYNRFLPENERPNQGFSGNDLETYLYAFKVVVEILKPQKIIFLGNAIKSKIQRLKRPKAFANENGQKQTLEEWANTKDIILETPIPLHKFSYLKKSKVNYKKQSNKELNSIFSWLEEGIQTELHQAINTNDGIGRFFIELNYKSPDEIDKLSYPELLKMYQDLDDDANDYTNILEDEYTCFDKFNDIMNVNVSAFFLFLCLKKIIKIEYLVQHLINDDEIDFELMLDLVESKDLYVTNTAVPTLLEFVKTTQNLCMVRSIDYLSYTEERKKWLKYNEKGDYRDIYKSYDYIDKFSFRKEYNIYVDKYGKKDPRGFENKLKYHYSNFENDPNKEKYAKIMKKRIFFPKKDTINLVEEKDLGHYFRKNWEPPKNSI